MAAILAVPAEAMRGRRGFGADHPGADHDQLERELPDRGPAQEAIAEMARLLHDTRDGMFLDGSVLSAITIGIAVEAAFSPSVLRPSMAGLACGALLAGLIICWLRAGALLLLAGRPVLDQLNDQRWRAGAPLDPRRARWLTSAPSEENADAWARVNLLLGAARIRRERIHLVDTWTFITAACFLAWTATVLLGA
jgi:hypothetical protein